MRAGRIPSPNQMIADTRKSVFTKLGRHIPPKNLIHHIIDVSLFVYLYFDNNYEPICFIEAPFAYLF